MTVVTDSFITRVKDNGISVFQMRYFPNFVASGFKVESLPKELPEQCITGKLDGTPVTTKECMDIRGSILTILDWCLNDVDSEILYKVVPYNAVVIRNCQYEVEIVSDRANAPFNGAANLFHLLYPAESYSYAYNVKVTVTKARTWSANYKPIDNFEGDLSQFDLDKFLKQQQTPKANNHYGATPIPTSINHYGVTPIPTKMTEPAAQVRVEPKGYTSVGMDIDGNSNRSGLPEDMFASIVAEATKHVNNVKEGNTPALKVEDGGSTVKINATGKDVEPPSKEAIDKYVKHSLEEAKDAFADKMRQSLQEAKDEGMTVTAAQRGDTIAEDDFDFDNKK